MSYIQPPPSGKPITLEIVQWRETFDDEDGLDVIVSPSGDATDLFDVIREAHGISKPQGYTERPDSWDASDEPGNLIASNHLSYADGDVIESRGRKFRINLTPID